MKLLAKTSRFLPIMCVALPGIAMAGNNGAPVVEQSGEDIIKRLERIERKLNNQSLLDLYNQVQTLQAEVQDLRGRLDTQRHMLDEMTRRQKDLYADLDKRLQELQAARQANDENATQTSQTATDSETSQSGTTDGGTDTASAGDSANGDSPATSATADSPDSRKAYDDAFNLLKNGQYEQAIGAFQQYLKDYPDGDLADNAHYWLGEAHYVSRDFDKAITAYRELIKAYPDSQKAPHAKLKIGYSQQEMGDSEQAIKTLKEVRSQYPDTTAASLARDRIQTIQSAGN